MFFFFVLVSPNQPPVGLKEGTFVIEYPESLAERFRQNRAEGSNADSRKAA